MENVDFKGYLFKSHKRRLRYNFYISNMVKVFGNTYFFLKDDNIYFYYNGNYGIHITIYKILAINVLTYQAGIKF